MLEIWTKRTTLYNPAYYEWEVGKDTNWPYPGDVDCIRATGDELGSILAHFANIPYMRNAKVQWWYGHMAILIVSGLMELITSPKIDSGFKSAKE